MEAYLSDLFKSLKAKLVKAHKSLVIWFNGFTGSLVVLLPFLQDQVPQLNPYMSENFFRYAMCVIVFGNIILRFKTEKSLADK